MRNAECGCGSGAGAVSAGSAGFGRAVKWQGFSSPHHELTSVGTSRCDVPARESAGGIVRR